MNAEFGRFTHVVHGIARGEEGFARHTAAQNAQTA
jgi:hypothetical protein